MILFLFSLTSFNDIFIKVSEIPLDSAYYVVSTGAYPFAGCTMLDNIVTMKDGKRIFVYNWGYKNHNKGFFLLILSKDGKTIAEVPTDYRLITCDRNNNLYFLTHFGEDIKHPVIGIYKMKEGNR